jgi:hypothetical protein
LERSQCRTLEEEQQKSQDLINVLQTDYDIKISDDLKSHYKEYIITNMLSHNLKTAIANSNEIPILLANQLNENQKCF